MWGHRKGGPPSGELRVFTDIFVLPLGHRTKKEGEIVRAKNTGFTIVELLIVIVVIGVLAAISIVAYTGITQKANNAAIISAANQTLKAIQAYMAAKGDYPTKTQVCVTIDSGCKRSGVDDVVASDSGFNTAMAGVAKPPTRVPNSGVTAYGIYTHYAATRTYNDEPRPLIFSYFLQGINQQCGMEVADSNSNTMSTSTRGYTSGDINYSGKTLCVVSVPAP
jgi:prepilin-type N-terminal cleavage/methylation domain-containing protein